MVSVLQCYSSKTFFSFPVISRVLGYCMSWCAGCLSWWGPLQRGDLWRGFNQLLIDVWLLVSEVSTLNLILLTTQTMVTTGILPPQGNPPGRTGIRTRDLVICSQKLWPLDHEAGPSKTDRASKLPQAATLPICMLEVLHPNFDQNINHSESIFVFFLSSSCQVPRYYP